MQDSQDSSPETAAWPVAGRDEAGTSLDMRALVPAGEKAGGVHLGFDIGGTNLKWAVVTDTGLLDDHGSVRIADGRSTTEGVLSEIHDVISGLRSTVKTVGIGLPGRVDAVRGVTEYVPNLTGDWTGFPLAARVTQLAQAPVRLANDVHMLANAELCKGAARGATEALFIAIGTGVGGAIVIGGRVITGRTGVAGAIGHTTLRPDGPVCICGNAGCLEVFASGPAIAAMAGLPTAHDVALASATGSVDATEALRAAGNDLGVAIANVVTLLWPEVVVVGGGVGQNPTLLDAIRQQLSARVRIGGDVTVPVKHAESGPLAGAIGAALWPHEKFA